MRTGLILGAAALALLVGTGAALAIDPPEDRQAPPEPVWPPGGKGAPLPSDTPTLPPGTVAPYHKPIPRVGDDLVSTRWRAVTIRGRPVAKGHEPTLDFVDDGHLRGSTGCNRFVGPWATRVDKGVIGPLDTTRSACPPGLVAQDQDVIDTLEHTEKLALQEKGAVLLIYAKGAPQPSRFARVP
jgi:heat shock protein HslJ